MKKKSILTTVVAVLAAVILNWAGLLPTPQSGPQSGPQPGASGGQDATVRSQPTGDSIAYSALPGEAREDIRLIQQSGPIPYQKDGTTFGNRERLLPLRDHGYYREYTVRTQGESTRGARRIVAGGAKRSPDVLYYTADHYRSFKRVQGGP